MKTINMPKDERYGRALVLSQQINRSAIMFAFVLGLIAVQAQATPIIIQDNYIGGTPTNTSWNGKDIVGAAEYFDISKMEVSFISSDTMIIDVYSRYFNNIGKYNTQLGDLFISTNGYQGDNEQWEYALKLDTYLPNITRTTSGNISLYNIQTANIRQSFSPYIFRAGQEVQYNPNGQSSLATGSWELLKLGGSDTDDYLQFAITYDFGNISNYGFHWTMTCGNDVIEGAAPVPEPATLLIFGSGLIGLGCILRRTIKKNGKIGK